MKINHIVHRGHWHLVVIGKASDIQKYAQKNMETLREIGKVNTKDFNCAWRGKA
ncbi:hypothetical protein [Brevibacillus laterosporus]|uniref:hypothetical protein n=1 Tax=Brevibacillus laterosporus TaxID=1465 RepID=UPI0003B21E2D|nr:hypothetical protein [Brevibacillus laterosporus]ERM17318.1 hypothetical protein P615_21230 [Brevibacillus laterosporus PE36]